MKRILKNAILWCLLVCCGGVLCQSSAYAVARVEGIDMDSVPGILQIGLSERTSFKVLTLDTRQIMVAFRPAEISHGVAENRSGEHLIKQVKIEKLPNQVVSLMIDTAEDITDVGADWQDDSGTLLVRFVSAGKVPQKMIPIKRRRFVKKTIPQEESRVVAVESSDVVPDTDTDVKPPAEQTEKVPPTPIVTSEMTTTPVSDAVLDVPVPDPAAILSLSTPGSEPKKEDGVDGLIVEISRSECSQTPILTDALKLAEQKEWEKIFNLLSPALDPVSSDVCQADLYYLRAFAAYKMNRSGNDRLYLDAVNYFQDAASYFPESPLTPYGLLSLATIYNDMDNLPEARGYYNIVLKTYSDHPVYAEALFRLGMLFVKEGKQNQAIKTFRKYMEEFPQSSHLTDTMLALGKCLYEINEFTDALAVLRKVVEEDPACIYKDSDLLVYIGKLNYQLGKFESARDAMAKAVNLFPENDAVPDLLTRIADTFKNGNQADQAKKIYQLVMEKYPGTDGFAISAVRYAGLLTDPAEKEAIYQNIIKDFPGHPMAKLALVRLADLQSQAGEYAASIETLRGLMSGNLSGMQNEVTYAMESSYIGFFRQLTDKNGPVAVISAYEKDKHLISRLENPDILEIVGTAFFKAHFYGQAAELFQKSYKLSSPENRTVDLYYQLGITFQELGKNMQAREMFDAYFQKVPNDQVQPDACLRMGRLLVAEKSWESALAFFKTGLLSSRSDLEKADFLISQAEAYQNLGKEVKVPGLLIEAINRMASSPDVRSEQLMQVHRSLGESYLKLAENDKAVDAFTMALKFSTESRPPGLLYLLAKSNMKAHRSEAAKNVLLEIINSGDDFWGRMAQEQLRAMELEAKLKES